MPGKVATLTACSYTLSSMSDQVFVGIDDGRNSHCAM